MKDNQLEKKKSLALKSLEESLERLIYIRGSRGLIFDLQTRTVLKRRAVIDICIPSGIFALWLKHSARASCDPLDVGYDSQHRYSLMCNLYDGTPESEARLNSLLFELLTRGAREEL